MRSAKNLIFGRRIVFLGGFLAIWGSFWQITFVGVSEKPISRAFVRRYGKCQKFVFVSIAGIFGILKWIFGIWRVLGNS